MTLLFRLGVGFTRGLSAAHFLDFRGPPFGHSSAMTSAVPHVFIWMAPRDGHKREGRKKKEELYALPFFCK
jgi:hypothetical protein